MRDVTIMTLFDLAPDWWIDQERERGHTEGVPTVYLSVDEAALRLDVHRQRIYEFIWSGRLKAIKDPETRTWLVSEESVNAFQKKPRGRPRINR